MTLPAVIAALLRPEPYPHPVAEVSLIQTHISYVLLAGAHVYKIKKPVRFSFLDFSTPERRHHFCLEEVRLNRRLAADMYLGVVGICHNGAGYRLGDEADSSAVEYAVHMRRLPAGHTLDQLLDRHAVTPEMIEQVAARLVDFHRAADASSEVIANGDPAAIRRVLEDNFAGMRSFRDVTIPAADDDTIQTFSREFLQRNLALLRRRQMEHRIRDGHGDLHTEHICFDRGISIFDCVEFNPAFRYCDVASDLAFLAMDLEYHRRGDLAAQLISVYARLAEDPDLRRLVPFYQCYRAYVRGKVDSLKSAEEEVDRRERERASSSAQHHFELAYRYTWAYSPCLVIIAGLSGTGKSAVAAMLHRRTGFAHINSDVVRKQLAGIPPVARHTAAYGAGLYSAEHTERTYAAMFSAAAERLAAGSGVILDATFQRRADRDRARAVAAEHKVPIFIVECHCSELEVRRRLEQRARRRESPSDADWGIYVEQSRRYEPFTAEERETLLEVDTAGPIAASTAALERALRTHTPPRQ